MHAHPDKGQYCPLKNQNPAMKKLSPWSLALPIVLFVFPACTAPEGEASAPSDGASASAPADGGQSTVVASPRTVPGDALDLVPNVVGMGLKDALFILENRGLHVRIVGNGMVRRQSLRPGSRFNNGSAIILELA